MLFFVCFVCSLSERPSPPRVFRRQRRVHVSALSTVCQQRPPLSPGAGRGSWRVARAHQQEDVSAGEGGGGAAGENRTFPSKPLHTNQILRDSSHVSFSTAVNPLYLLPQTNYSIKLSVCTLYLWLALLFLVNCVVFKLAFSISFFFLKSLFRRKQT